jgi:hypothetical protein
VVTRTNQWAYNIEAKKLQKIKDYLDMKQDEETKEVTFKPYLIAEEKLNEQAKSQVTAPIETNFEAIDKFYQRMDRAHL